MKAGRIFRHLAGDRVPVRLVVWLSILVPWISSPSYRLGADAPSVPGWIEEAGFRHRPLRVAATGHAGFGQLPPAVTGVNFTNVLTDNEAALNQILTNGSGVAAGDVDGDGWCDLYFCRLGGPNALYHNLGNRRFEEVAAVSGVACVGLKSTGACFADVDGDGDLDLIVNTLGAGTHVFLNDGSGRFTESPRVLNPQKAGTSMTLADIDGDGDLDLYVANYRSTTVRSTGLQMLLVNGKKTLRPEDREGMYITPDGYLREYGEVDVLYLNDGKGGFSPESWTDGRFLDENGKPLGSPPKDWGLSAMFRDLNGDGFPDLYVCNDFWTPDRIWMNDGHGRFRALSRDALPVTPTFSMGIDFADLNRDGIDDFLVLDMLGSTRAQRVRHPSHVGGDGPYVGNAFERPQIERNTLFLGRGDGTFSEIAQYSGIAATDWSWCPLFLDVDLDGFEDLIIGAGNLFDTQDADADVRIQARGRWPRERIPYKLLEYPRLPQATHAYRNRGDLTFQETGHAWGLDAVGVSHGMCLADLDNDGGLEVIANVMNGPARIFWNESGAPRVAVRLRGLPPNIRGIGARIRLRGGAVPSQTQEMICGGRYLSGDENERVFAAGSLTNSLTLDVEWPGGQVSTLRSVVANHLYEVIQPPKETVRLRSEPVRREAPHPVFEDLSALLNHVHTEAPDDEFQHQPLLPRRLSQAGPGIAWFDLDADGWEDLIITGGRDGPLTIFHNRQGQGFDAVANGALLAHVGWSQTAVLGIGPGRVLVGEAKESGGDGDGGTVELRDLAHATTTPIFAPVPWKVGALSMADFDGDGQIDLFVAGRSKPDRYPEAAPSRLYRGVENQFQLIKEFADLGRVAGVCWSDLDGDGFPDLLVATEWGPVRIFHNDRGTFREITSELGMDSYRGWWTGLAVGDFDEDGRLDFVAGNWGLNSPYLANPEHPLRLYYGDFTGSGSVDILESGFDPELGTDVPLRDLDSLLAAIPSLREIWPTHASFAQSTVSNLFGPHRPMLRRVEATTLESMIFLNRGDHFEAHPLPAEAQWSPVTGIAVGDMDGDGHDDVFLSQNCFGVNNSVSLLNSGRGLWLKGNGHGDLSPVPGQVSGVRLYGDQRGAALGDYDSDGRLDLVVGQNAAATQLYHNVTARPGLRIRMRGPSGNPRGIGVQLRMKSALGVSGVREIHAGSGYWSEDSPVQLLASPELPAELEARWPGGQVVTTRLVKHASEIEVDFNGKLRVIR